MRKKILSQEQDNVQRHIWVLSGTSDGFLFAKNFVERGWNVSVSVVSREASLPYLHLSIENLWVGAINGVDEIKGLLFDSENNIRQFDYVVDATHPFAIEISTNLGIACKAIGQPLVRYERPLDINLVSSATFISTLNELSEYDLLGRRFLFAIGSRHLDVAIRALKTSGGIPYARILPNPESIKKAINSDIEEKHIAIVKPFKSSPLGQLEVALCRKWNITDIVFRESGGTTQKTWTRISQEEGIDIWIVRRPKLRDSVLIANSLEDISMVLI